MIHIPLTLTAMQSNLPLIPQIMLRNKSKKLDRNFHPGDYDIICGRGKSAHHHPGNKRFRLVISMIIDEYKKAPTKVDKSLVIIKIVDIIWRWGGAFVKMDKAQNKWNTIDDRLTVSNILLETAQLIFNELIHLFSHSVKRLVTQYVMQ